MTAKRKHFIVRRGTEYLVAIAYLDSKTPRWSISPYDAVRIPWRDDADRVARIVGGEVVLFDQTTGDVTEKDGKVGEV